VWLSFATLISCDGYLCDRLLNTPGARIGEAPHVGATVCISIAVTYSHLLVHTLKLRDSSYYMLSCSNYACKYAFNKMADKTDFVCTDSQVCCQSGMHLGIGPMLLGQIFDHLLLPSLPLIPRHVLTYTTCI
jgi:hypothetical protein